MIRRSSKNCFQLQRAAIACRNVSFSKRQFSISSLASSNSRILNRSNSKLFRNKHVLPKFYSTLDKRGVDNAINDLGEKFQEARELLEDARESFGTVYFSEDFDDAIEAVDDILNDYKVLLSSVNEKEAADIQKRIGMRVLEVKAEVQQLKDMALE